MGTTMLFKPTAVQKKALALLKGGAKHILLFGEFCPGKTTVLMMALIYRALRFAGSRHLICRYRAKDVRSSVLRKTLSPWPDNTINNVLKKRSEGTKPGGNMRYRPKKMIATSSREDDTL
jgi:hypothetical protein